MPRAHHLITVSLAWGPEREPPAFPNGLAELGLQKSCLASAQVQQSAACLISINRLLNLQKSPAAPSRRGGQPMPECLVWPHTKRTWNLSKPLPAPKGQSVFPLGRLLPKTGHTAITQTTQQGSQILPLKSMGSRLGHSRPFKAAGNGVGGDQQWDQAGEGEIL